MKFSKHRFSWRATSCFLRPTLGATLLLLAVLIGCSSSKRYEPRRLNLPSVEAPSAGSTSQAQPVQVLPWELWPRGQDLMGAELHSGLVKEGDDAVEQGLRQKALEYYYRAQSGPLAPSEQEALVLRIASSELAVDQPVKSLNTLSAYFRSTNKTVDEVSPLFALVFGYAYCRNRDAEQSIAWFSRAAAGVSGIVSVRSSAERGMRVLLRSVSEENLDNFTSLWSADVSVRSLIGEERARRAAGGQVTDGRDIDIWGEPSSMVMNAAPPVSTSVVVGVLLPLSGKYSALGQATKNGMEMALEGQRAALSASAGSSAPPLIRASFRDTGIEVHRASDAARELVSSEGAKLLVGPLIAEHALAVQSVSRQTAVPMLSLSKNSNFPTGDGSYRLGATVESQVYSLLEASQNIAGLKRFALIFPDDSGGIEFADAFRQQLHARNIELVYEGRYPRNSTDTFLTMAQAVEAAGADGVIFPDSLTTAARFFGNFSASFRQSVHPLGVANWDNAAQLANSSTVLDGAIFVSPFFVQSARPQVAQFVAAYRAKYNQTPDFLAAQGFDALTLVQEITRRQQIDQVSWTVAAGQFDAYEGLTGRISLRDDGEFERQFRVIQLKGGMLQELQPQEQNSFIYRGNQAVSSVVSDDMQKGPVPVLR
ncbi:MAG: penicillin-binding protein activator [Oligoflexia bacterium]|nr:penicillin-binding protein activator [Oligoflexia bacterium]